jgi:CNT family concentrative nucleoside transporter
MTTIRPHLARMTRSEFCTILTAGMATVASSTLGVYVLFLKDTFPTIAGHLISASIMSAPAALVMSKLLLPEDGQPVTLGRTVDVAYERESSAVESIINGAMAGVKLVVGVCALLLAFLGLLALVNLGLGGLSHVLAQLFGVQVDLSLSTLLGYLMWPLAVVMGVPPQDAMAAARLLGERLVITELPAYQHLATALEAGAFSHPRSPVLVAYALCGFAHVASLAIFVGGAAALVPERRKDLAAVGFRALVAATLACLMTGCVAGTFFHAAETVISNPVGAAP